MFEFSVFAYKIVADHIDQYYLSVPYVLEALLSL